MTGPPNPAGRSSRSMQTIEKRMSQKKQRLNLVLSSDDYKEIKKEAIDQGRPLSKIILEMVQEKLKERKNALHEIQNPDK